MVSPRLSFDSLSLAGRSHVIKVFLGQSLAFQHGELPGFGVMLGECHFWSLLAQTGCETLDTKWMFVPEWKDNIQGYVG